jgi:CheY-like chemotaxis protein
MSTDEHSPRTLSVIRHPWPINVLPITYGGDIVCRMPTVQARPNPRAEGLRDRHWRVAGSSYPAGQPHEQPARPADRIDWPAVRPGSLPRILTGLKILVVDDDPDILELFSLALTSCGGDVTAADNASEALALAIRTRPQVIVSDIAMIGEDGYWLVGRLRQLPSDVLPAVPVIAATAYGREHSRARVLAAGFTEHLQKPVDPEELCRVVAKVAGR